MLARGANACILRSPMDKGRKAAPMTPERKEHPFARFVAILGRGKTKQRHLTFEEARESMAMILRRQTEPEQTGAFLMLLRLKEESPEEIAGFAAAARDVIAADMPWNMPRPEFDIPSYAGKRRQLPWFLLAAFTLAGLGRKVCMHGAEGHTAGRLYIGQVLATLGMRMARDWSDAAARLERDHFTYVPLSVLQPRLEELINLKPILGLRSPVNTFPRLINPLGAPVMINGIFHRGFLETHTGAARRLGQPRFAVFRGEGGEPERRVGKTCEIAFTHGDTEWRERWPAMLEEPRVPVEEGMLDARLLAAVWRGEARHEYGETAAIGTLAAWLRAAGDADSAHGAASLARDMWQDRPRELLKAA